METFRKLPQVLNSTGGKAGIAPWIIAHFPPHDIYVEPFGGSGAVLINKSAAKMEVFNDLNGGLVHFFQVLASEPENLIERVDGLLYSPFRDSRPTEDPVEIAARFFLHNNTTWPQANANNGFRPKNGNHKRTVSVIFQKRKALLAQVAARIRNVIFERRDAVDVISKYDGPNVLFYVDPPYYGERRADLYKHEMMDEESHRRLAEALHACQGSVVLSGYNSALYQELYSDWTVDSRPAMTNGKNQRMECLWVKTTEKETRISPKRPNARSGWKIIKQQIREAAKCPFNGKTLPRGKITEISDTLISASQKQRAKNKGIGSRSQYELDKVARLRPELLKEIADKNRSLQSAYNLCTRNERNLPIEQLKRRFFKLSDAEQIQFKEWVVADPVFIPYQKVTDLSGQRFKQWTVLDDHKWLKRQTRWQCRCTCGTVKWVDARDLASGRARSCGCAKRIDLIGQQFGRWTVLNKHKFLSSKTIWQCRCACGTVKWVDSKILRRGSSKSCGCSRRKAVTVAAPTA